MAHCFKLYSATVIGAAILRFKKPPQRHRNRNCGRIGRIFPQFPAITVNAAQPQPQPQFKTPASPKNSIKIHEHCCVAPPLSSSATQSSLPLTSFDLLWLRYHPAECILFYPFPIPHTDSSFFFNKVVPKLKTSLSQTLQHFLPLPGNIIWPHDSEIPIIKYTPGDDDEGGVSLFIAEYDADLNHILDNSSPQDAIESRSFIPHLESSDSLASLISVQVTLIQNQGFCIGFSFHHAFLDGISAIMFIKAWGSLCSSESLSLVPELEPFLDRKVIKDTTGRDLFLKYNMGGRSLKIPPMSQHKLEDSVRTIFELPPIDLDKLKKMVLSKWDTVVVEEGDGAIVSSKPHDLSSFIVTSAYVSVCIAKAIQGVEKETQKFALQFIDDCRARSELPIPGNYFGNCVWGRFVDTNPSDYTKEDGLIIVAKKIHNKIEMLDKRVPKEGYDDVISKVRALSSEGVNIIAVAGSNQSGMYGIDFGWGRPSKVEMTSSDKVLGFSILDTKGGNGGSEVGLVLNKHVMDLFNTYFHAGLCID